MIDLILFQLFVLVLMARIFALLFESIKIPPLVGEILAGIIIGNTFLYSFLHLETDIEVLRVFSELGVIFLLFTIGLETPFSELKRVGRTSTLVAILGVVFPFAFGYLLIISLGHPQVEALFIGAAMVATSVGITARVIKDMGLTHSIEARVIIGAAVIDDILGMVVLAIVSGIAVGGTLNIIDTLVVAVLAVLFVLAVIYVGTGLLPRARNKVKAKKRTGRSSLIKFGSSPLALALILCFGLSALASYIGLAAIIGAFLAGMVFAEFSDTMPVAEKFEPINEFLVPFFFLYIGISVKIGSFAEVAILSLAITALAIVTKFIGCGLGAYKLGRKSATVIGVGMSPRGEVGLIVASVGLGIGSISSAMFSVVVAMSLLTTLIAPPLLTYTFRRTASGKSMKFS